MKSAALRDTQPEKGAKNDGPSHPIPTLTETEEAVRLLTCLASFRPVAETSANGTLPANADTNGDAKWRVAEARYQALVEQIPVVTFFAHLDGSTSQFYISPQIEKLLGFTATEWIENPFLWYKQIHPDDREGWNEAFARTCYAREHFRSEFRFLARDGRVVWVHGEARMVCDANGLPQFLHGAAYDITERKLAADVLEQSRDELEAHVRERTAELTVVNQALQAEIAKRKEAEAEIKASLEEKKVLLKEIHHRVKNNLQVISTLLYLQSDQAVDPATVEMFRETQNRVKTMALVHERLYTSRDAARVDFRDYLQNLAEDLFRSYRVDDDVVTLTVEVGDVQLAIDKAIPCGLIVNELVSNCLKHAFPDHRKGGIEIELHPVKEDVQLLVSDNGVGVPEDHKLEACETFGWQLVATLVEQLRGNLRIVRGLGTTVQITFPLAEPNTWVR